MIARKMNKNRTRKDFQVQEMMQDEVAMMCWENLDESQDKEPNKEVGSEDKRLDDDNEKQNYEEAHEENVESTVKNTGNQLEILIEEFNLGMQDNASTLTTQETSLKKSVYITNIKKQTDETLSDPLDFSTKVNKEEGPEDKKPPAKNRSLERSSSINSIDDLEDYEESGSENDERKETKRKKNRKKSRKIIHIEFNSDDDKKEQTKNATDGNQIEVEGKVHIKKKIIHNYELCSEDDSKSSGKQAKHQK